MFLIFLLLTGFVSGQRSRSRILRERLYLETLTNQSKMIKETATNAFVSLKPLDTTTTPPTPSTEGMDYEGSGFLDVFWKLTARAGIPSTVAPSTTPDAIMPKSTTTSTPRPIPTSSENVFDQYDGYYYDVTPLSTTRRSTSTSTTRRTTIRTTTLPSTTRRMTSRPTTPKTTTRKTTPRTTTPATPRHVPVMLKAREAPVRLLLLQPLQERRQRRRMLQQGGQPSGLPFPRPVQPSGHRQRLLQQQCG